MHNELSKAEISHVKKCAREKLGECRKSNDIIGTQIFSILSLYARVIYYPLGEKAPWGFTRIRGSKREMASEKPIVAINTSIPVDCQVFAAAHELYHIWYEQNADVVHGDDLDEQKKELREKKASRFAAEFLVDEMLLKQEMGIYGIDKITVKSILKLCELFSVPYRTIVKRLHEEKYITKTELEKFLNESDSSVNMYRRMYAYYKKMSDERVVMDNLVELAVSAYSKGYITYEKLEYLLQMSKLTPEEVGIERKEDYQRPSDDELDSIMEE